MLREARPGDDGVLVEMLRVAFADDPLYVWLQPDPERRSVMLREVFASVLAQGRERGEVHTTEALDAVAVWTAPGVGLIDDAAAERYLALLRAHVGDERLADAEEGMAAVDRCRPVTAHRTLHSVAVAPGSRGRGVGAALVRPVLDRCDAEGVGAFLDSSNPRNLPFYARLGFATVAEVPLPGDGPVMRALLRASSRA